MITLGLALVFLLATPPELDHVRTTEPRILAALTFGLERSVAFCDLVATLNATDVIVYIVPKVGRDQIGGYLSHTLVSAGGHRYLRIAIDTRGSDNRVARRLAHELQHAVEVAHMTEARDEESLRRVLADIAIPFRCNGHCYETQRALDVESIVDRQLRQRSGKAACATPNCQ